MRYVAILALASLAAAGRGAAQPAAPPPRGLFLPGVWENESRFGLFHLRFDPDGTWTRMPHRGGDESGRFSIRDGALEIRPAGGGETRLTMVAGPKYLVLGEGDRSLQIFERRRRRPFDNGPLEPRLDRLAPSSSGHILFTRYESMMTPRGATAAPRIWIMTGDGGASAPFIAPRDAFQVSEPRFARGGRRMVFSSDYEMARSAYWADIFEADLESGEVRRITGSERSLERQPGRADVDLGIELSLSIPPELRNDVRVAWQGGGDIGRSTTARELGIELPKDAAIGGVVRLTDIPAGRLWVKVWSEKHVGDLQVLDLRPDEPVAARSFDLTHGNRLATEPHPSADGCFVVGLWQHAFWDRKVGLPGEPEARRDELERKGYDTIAIFDAVRGGEPLASWNPPDPSLGARDPALSPDDRSIAFAVGLLPSESIAVCRVEDLRAGRSVATVISPGRLMPGQGAVGHRDPAWSPDGSRLAFVRYVTDLSGRLRGDLVIARADGSEAGQLTALDANEVPANPTWSPDGRQIAFQRVTGRTATLTGLHIATLDVDSDIWVIDTAGGTPRRLTTGGRSGEPSWGP